MALTKAGEHALRAVVAIAAGIAAAVAVAATLELAAGLLAGWAAYALVQALGILARIWPMDASRTRAHATAEDPGRVAARVVVIAGSFASLAAVAFVLVRSGDASPTERIAYAGIAVVSVAASWLVIQADYTLRLARIYYDEPVGGIDFNQPEDPQYTDFVYVSLGLGMTYQVGDTAVRTNAIRRLVIAQTTFGYVFGAIILATVINLVSGLGD